VAVSTFIDPLSIPYSRAATQYHNAMRLARTFACRSTVICPVRCYCPRLPLAECSIGDSFQREGRWWVVEKVIGNVKVMDVFWFWCFCCSPSLQQKGSETKQSMIVLKDLLTSAKKEVRVKSGEKVDIVEILTIECKILRQDGRVFVLSALDSNEADKDGEEVEEIRVSSESMGILGHYLTKDMTVLVRVAVCCFVCLLVLLFYAVVSLFPRHFRYNRMERSAKMVELLLSV
jgi:translation elongation factor P/translation initiation factor 5A